MSPTSQEKIDESRRSKSARALINLLNPMVEPECMKKKDGHESHKVENDILSAIRDLLPELYTDRPLFAGFHDGQVHHPLGGGAYAYQNDIVGPLLLALTNDEIFTTSNGIGPGATNNPTRPIVVHIGAQPNNSPHAGTLVVFSLAFLLAMALQGRTGRTEMPPVSVEVALVDTAPLSNETCEINGVRYQRSYRDDPAALAVHMGDYQEVLGHMSKWSGIPYRTSFQSDFFSHSLIPSSAAFNTQYSI